MLAVCAVAALPRASSAQNTNYVIGPQDVLNITVWEQADLSGKFSVEADGSFSFPLLGRIKAGGMTLRAVEDELKTKLGEGFFKNPQVTVSVEQYRSQRVFVVGEVRTPGAYSLSGDTTLIEALARAGSTSADAGGEVLIIRSPGNVGAPVLPNQDGRAEVIHIDLHELQTGLLSQNAQLHDDDTIFVPRAELIYVFGQVQNPGAYPYQRGTTVLQALSLAHGVTDRGASGRAKVVRIVNGKKTEVKVKLDDLVKPGDTVVVPERFF